MLMLCFILAGLGVFDFFCYGRYETRCRKNRLFTAVRRWGLAARRPGQIPGWWWSLFYKPDPIRLFGAPDWPAEVDSLWHLQRQHMIDAKYSTRPWYPAYSRGITWYELCRERESLAASEVALSSTPHLHRKRAGSKQ